ncbi:MAG: hypothetical protein PHT94_00675 [Candidatus Nanoarchaeia archaeon]|nr:hypothetical protein [Candidatus Nanoarchaeia archaeon]
MKKIDMSKKPIVEFAGEVWMIDSVKGDEWNTESNVFVDQAFVGTKFEIRYNAKNIIYPAFQYKITSRKLNSKKTQNVTCWGTVTARITEVRGILYPYNDDETLGEGFGCTYYLRREF